MNTADTCVCNELCDAFEVVELLVSKDPVDVDVWKMVLEM